MKKTAVAAIGVLALSLLAVGPAAAQVFVQNNNLGVGTSNPTALLHLASTGQVRFLFQQLDLSTRRWDFKLNNNGFFNILLVGGVPQPELALLPANDAVGTLRIVGPVQASAFNIGSSRAIKENFSALEGTDVLAKVADLPISSWSYKEDPHSTTHIGPMAEDFHAAFGGADERHISVSDATGVALAAIQGLHSQLQERDQQIEQLLQRVGELESRLSSR